MKKLLTVLSTFTLSTVPTFTVISCGKAMVDKKPKKQKNEQEQIQNEINSSNSIANINLSSSVLGKQLILADQYGLSTNALKNSIKNLKAKEYDDSFDREDFDANSNPSIIALQEKYLNSVNKDKLKNINLNGSIGNGENELWNQLGVNNEGLTLILNQVFNIFGSVNSNNVSSIINSLPMMDGLLKEQVTNSSEQIEKIKTTVNNIFNDENLMANVKEQLSSSSLKMKDYSEIPVDNLLSIFWIQLGNGIGYILDDQYKAISMPENVKEKTGKAWREEFNSILSSVFKKISSGLDKKNNVGKNNVALNSKIEEKNNVGINIENANSQVKDIADGIAKLGDNVNVEKNKNDVDLNSKIDRYVNAAAYLIQSLQTLTWYFSLFDDYWEYSPVNSEYLFNDKENNKNIMKQILLNDISSAKDDLKGKKIGDILNVKFGSLNLRYLLNIILIPLTPENIDENNYRLQKLLTVLFASPYSLTDIPLKEMGQTENISKLNPFVRILSLMWIEKINKSLSDIPNFVKKTVERTIKNILFPFVGGFIELALSNQSVKIIFDNLFDDIMKLAKTIGWIGFLLPSNIKAPIDFIGNNTDAWKLFYNTWSSYIPLLKANDSWKILNSGKPFDFNELVKNKSQLLAIIDNMVVKNAEEENIRNWFKTFLNFENWNNNFFKFLNKDFNINNLLSTPFERINNPEEQMSIDFGIYYRKTSISDFANEYFQISKTKQFKKITDPSIQKMNLEISSIAKIFEKIQNYDYLMSTPSDEKNLVLKILNNPDKASEILGYVKSEKNNIKKGSGSLLDLIFYDIFKIDLESKTFKYEDPLEFTFKLTDKIFRNLNFPVREYKGSESIYNELLRDFFLNPKSNFVFKFSNSQSKDKIVLFQKTEVNFINFKDNSKWTYIFNFSRNKNNGKFNLDEIIKSKY